MEDEQCASRTVWRCWAWRALRWDSRKGLSGEGKRWGRKQRGPVGEPAEGWKTEWSGEEGGLGDDERAENWVKNEAAAETRRSEEAFWSSFHKSPAASPFRTASV